MPGKLIETIYGKHHKYEIRESTASAFSKKYVIYRDGGRWKGDYDSIAKAVDVAKNAG